jgi:hypothetical protein
LQDFFEGAVGWCVCLAPDRNRTRGKPAVDSAEESGCLQGLLNRSNG